MMLRMTDQMAPSRKSSGAVVISCQISVSFSFHVESEELRVSMIKMSMVDHLLPVEAAH